MGFEWTPRQFVGGAVCLDFANTVTYPADPARRYDRIESATDLRRWAASANDFALRGDGEGEIAARGIPDARAFVARARRLRDCVDELFRPLAAGHSPPAAALRELLGLYRAALEEAGSQLELSEVGLAPQAARGTRLAFRALIAHSAVRLAFSPRLERLKACPSCHWLFVDRSKSGRRLWCDMLTCGNRAKARRRYRRERSGGPG
ncbi:MAG: CGNR zinc finger domain-containing protein [Kiloniellales bacterium]